MLFQAGGVVYNPGFTIGHDGAITLPDFGTS